MPGPSSSPRATGSPPSGEPANFNDTGVYVGGAPRWWHPHKLPAQVAKTRDYLLAQVIGLDLAKAHPINGVLMYGPPGTGKTSAGVAVLYDWGRQGETARFQDFSELMVRIRSAWRKDAAQTVEQIHAEMMKPHLLLLDDIGKRATPEDQETLSVLVNGRINRGRPTLLTTNCDLGTPEGRAEFLAAADSRVLERYSKCDVHVGGANLRRA
jgi:DNA replication protein DnaC